MKGHNCFPLGKISGGETGETYIFKGGTHDPVMGKSQNFKA
jgi:hypothetical protein